MWALPTWRVWFASSSEEEHFKAREPCLPQGPGCPSASSPTGFSLGVMRLAEHVFRSSPAPPWISHSPLAIPYLWKIDTQTGKKWGEGRRWEEAHLFSPTDLSGRLAEADTGISWQSQNGTRAYKGMWQPRGLLGRPGVRTRRQNSSLLLSEQGCRVGSLSTFSHRGARCWSHLLSSAALFFRT